MALKDFNPFLTYNYQLQALLDKASKQKNPSLWLFQNNARTPLFMLEGLTRLHNQAFDEKLFTKWHKRFKKLEDSFGQIDYYFWLQNEFKTNKQVNKDIVLGFSDRFNKLMEKNNNRLLEKGWFVDKLSGFNSKLLEYTVDYNKEYINELKMALMDEIESIQIFVQKIDFSFTKFEEEVHELRRKLRWLSIYSQCLNGLIQLKPTTTKTKFKIHYFTKEILKSPYNKLPVKPKNTAILEFDRDAFFALSWMINELGEYKDKGLKIEALADAIFKTQDITPHHANQKALKALGLKENIEEQMLKEISGIVKTFITSDRILDKLIVK